MTCKNLCERYKAQKPSDGSARYGGGQRRCQICEIFITWEGLWCPCCGYRLRTKPRNIKYKAKLRAHADVEQELVELTVKKGDKVNVYEQIDGVMMFVGIGTLIEEIRAEGKYRVWKVKLKGKVCERFILAQ